MPKKKFDESKYEILEDMPSRFAQVIPGIGIQHFSKEHLSDNDIQALLNAKSPYVKSKENAGKEPVPEYTEDAPAGNASKKKEEVKPEYKDIGAGQFPQ